MMVFFKLARIRTFFVVLISLALLRYCWVCFCSPVANDFIVTAKLCNKDELLICDSGRSSKLIVYDRDFNRLYDISDVLRNKNFDRYANDWQDKYEVSKRSPFLIVRPNADSSWILVYLEKTTCREVTIPASKNLQLIDDFDDDKSYVISQEASDTVKTYLLSNESGTANVCDADFRPFEFRAVAKLNSKYFESKHFLPSKQEYVEVVKDSLAGTAEIKIANKRIMLRAPAGTLGTEAIGNQRIVTLMFSGYITNSWTLDQSGDFLQDSIPENKRLDFDTHPPYFPWVR